MSQIRWPSLVPDVWDLPGGHVEDGETANAALAGRGVGWNFGQCLGGRTRRYRLGSRKPSLLICVWLTRVTAQCLPRCWPDDEAEASAGYTDVDMTTRPRTAS